MGHRAREEEEEMITILLIVFAVVVATYLTWRLMDYLSDD